MLCSEPSAEHVWSVWMLVNHGTSANLQVKSTHSAKGLMTSICPLFPNWYLINILNAQCIHTMTFITKREQAISRHTPWQCFNLVHYIAIISHINEISNQRGKSYLWRSTLRQNDRQKEGKSTFSQLILSLDPLSMPFRNVACLTELRLYHNKSCNSFYIHSTSIYL